MWYLITHAGRESKPNPAHTTNGLCDLTSNIVTSTVSCIRSSGVNVVYVGTGRRFEETYVCFAPFLHGLRIEYSDIFGSGVSKKDKVGFVLEDGKVLSDDQYFGLADLKGIDWWEPLKIKLSDKAIIITGRQFCRCLGLKSKSCSIYEVNQYAKKIVCIIEKGCKKNELSIE